MTSIPQLRADINDLQHKLSAAMSRVKELESAPVTPMIVKVPFETVKIEYRDRVVEVPGPERIVEVVRDVQGPVTKEYRDRVVEVVDTRAISAKDIEIERLRSEIENLNNKLLSERNKPSKEKIVYRNREVKVPFETVKIEYRDRVVEVPKYKESPELIATIRQLQSIINSKGLN